MKAPLLLVAALAVVVGLASPVDAEAAPTSPTGCGEGAALPLAAAVPTTAAAEPAGWTVSQLAELDGDSNTGDFGSMGGDHAGLLTTSGGRTWFTRTLDAGETWSEPRALTSASYDVAGVNAAFTGSHVDVVSQQFSETALYRHSPDRGRTWGPTVRLAVGSSPTVARGAGDIVAIAAVRGDRFVVRVSADGGASFGPQRVVGRYHLDGCMGDTGVPAVAIADRAIVVSYWKDWTKLVTRRSTDRGASWSPATVLTDSEQGYVNTLVAHGKSVLAVHQSGLSLVSRISVDRGVTWSAARTIAAHTYDAHPSWSRGAWRLVDARGSLIRYRWSSDGQHWTSPVGLSNDPEFEIVPMGAAALTSTTLVPFITYRESADEEQILLASR